MEAGLLTRPARVKEPGHTITIRLRGLRGGGHSGFRPVLGEEPDHLTVKGRDIAGLAAADPVLIAHNLLVQPLTAGVANVVPDGVIAGKGAAIHQAR